MMTVGWSLQRRIMTWYVVLTLSIVVLFGSVTLLMIRGHLYSRIDAELVEEARELTQELAFAKSDDDFRLRFQRQFAIHGGFSFQVSRFDGTVIAGSSWLLAHALPRPSSPQEVSLPQLQDVMLPQLGLQRVLCRAARGPTESLVIHVLTPYAQTARELSDFTSMLVLAGTCAVIAAGFGAWMMARQTIRPINRMAQAAERISAESLSELVPVENPHDELGRLATTLNETFDRLRRSIEEMRRFTGDAAHELRTPLAVMRTTLEVALHREQSAPELLRAAHTTLAEVTRLSAVVDQLLSLSRLDAGLQTRDVEDVPLEALLQDVLESIQPAAERKQIRLSCDSLPQCVVPGDDVQLCRVFFNLLDNAIKFTPVGGAVRMSGELRDGTVRISVDDTGPGIESAQIPLLFQRFYRGDQSRNPQVDGAGLGLAICHSIVTAHHGQISVSSGPGRGSHFTVILPARPESPRERYRDAVEPCGSHATQPI